VVWNRVVQDRVKSWAVVKTIMSVRIITEDYLDRPNFTERLDACMCHAVRLPEIYLAGFTCRLQNCNNYISKHDCNEGGFLTSAAFTSKHSRWISLSLAVASDSSYTIFM
jgi:hypothetical protein